MTMCEARRGSGCWRGRALYVAVGVAVAVIVAVVYLTWLFVAAENKQIFRNVEVAEDFLESTIVDENVSVTSTTPTIVPPEPLTLRRTLYVGVMTMERYICTRARACNDTWARHPDISQLQFFSYLPDGHVMSRHPDVVALPAPGPDDVHRSGETFSMLEYVCREHVNNYHWFFRAVDDSYVKPERLVNILSTMDKRKRIYAGHPVETPAGDGRSRYRIYCAGGPGIIFSRKTMKDLCPHLKKCKAEFLGANADEQLGSCVYKYLGLECSRSSKLRDVFYDSPERNQVSLYEDMLKQEGSITLHPLKSPWMMEAVHQRHIKNRVTALKQKLEAGKLQLERLKSYSRTNNHPTSGDDVTRFTPTRPVPPTPSVTVVSIHTTQTAYGCATSTNGCGASAHWTAHTTHGCAASSNVSSALRQELQKAIALSRSSFRWGDLLDCHTFTGATYSQNTHSFKYSLNFKCNHTFNATKQVLATSELQRAALAPRVVKVRERGLGARLVTWLKVHCFDLKVLDFLLMWNNLVNRGKTYTKDYSLVMLVVAPSGGECGNETLEQGHLVARLENILRDVPRWASKNKLHVKMFYLNKTGKHQRARKKILKELRAENENSVILLAKPNMKFDSMFLNKCRMFVKAGKQTYRPQAVRQDSSGKFSWTKTGGPLCLHLADLFNINNRKKTRQSGRPSRPLKIIHSKDDSVQIL